MKCLCKYDWVKLPRDYPDMGKGLMSQLAFVQEFLGDLAEYATVTMDAVENALELNSLSLIE